MYSDLKVFVNDVEADASQYTVDIGSPAVADWVDGKIVTGIPGTQSSRSAVRLTAAKRRSQSMSRPRRNVPPTPVPDDPIRYVTIPSKSNQWCAALRE